MVKAKIEKILEEEPSFIRTEFVGVKSGIIEDKIECSRCGGTMIFVKSANGIKDYNCESCGKRLTQM